MRNLTNFLRDENWLCDFAFAVDVFSHLNELNVKLQGKDQFVHVMYKHVTAFKSKLVLFSRQVANASFTHFATLGSILRLATTKLTPDFDALTKQGDQQHCSH